MTPEDPISTPPDSTPEPFQIDPDFEPMYQLDARTYNGIVNRLFNLTLVSIHALQSLDDETSARAMAEQAHQILADYDEDLAEIVRGQVAPASPWHRDSDT